MSTALMFMLDLLSVVSTKGFSLLSRLIFPSSSYCGIRMEIVQPIVPPPPEVSSNRNSEMLIKQCCIHAECCSLTLPGSVQRLRFHKLCFPMYDCKLSGVTNKLS